MTKGAQECRWAGELNNAIKITREGNSSISRLIVLFLKQWMVKLVGSRGLLELKIHLSRVCFEWRSWRKAQRRWHH